MSIMSIESIEKKDFEENILDNLEDQNNLNENILDLDIENFKKGIAISHKKEFTFFTIPITDA